MKLQNLLFLIYSVLILSCKKENINSQKHIYTEDDSQQNIATKTTPLVITTGDQSISLINANTGAFISTNYTGSSYENMFITQSPLVFNNYYILFGGNIIMAFDFKTNQLIWKTIIDQGAHSTHSYFTSYPCVTGNLLFFMHGNFINSSPNYGYRFFCINIKNGAIEWVKPMNAKYGVGNGSRPSAPTLINDLVVVPVNDTLYALDSKNGIEKWRYHNTGINQIFNPYAYNGSIYITQTNKSQIKKDSLVALDGNSGNVLWMKKIGSIMGCNPAPICHNGRLFINLEDGISCLDTATGALIWNFNTTDKGIFYMCPPYISDGRIFVTNQGPVTLFSLDELTGNEEWDTFIGGGASLSNGEGPGVMNDLIYVRTSNDYMYSFNKEDGKMKWQTKMQNRSIINPSYAPTLVDYNGKMVYFSSSGMH